LIESIVFDGVRFVNGADSPFQGGYLFRALASYARPVTIRGLTIRNAWLVQTSASKKTVVAAPIEFDLARATSVDTAVPIEISNTVIRGGSTSLISTDRSEVNIILRNGSYGKDSALTGMYGESALFSGQGASSGMSETHSDGHYRISGTGMFTSGIQPGSTGAAISWFEKVTHNNFDLPHVSAASCSTTTTEVINGAELGDACTVSSNTPWGKGVLLQCSVSAPNTVQWQACNLTGTTVSHPPDTYTIRLLR
jgi:hypothetical protein